MVHPRMIFAPHAELSSVMETLGRTKLKDESDGVTCGRSGLAAECNGRHQ